MSEHFFEAIPAIMACIVLVWIFWWKGELACATRVTEVGIRAWAKIFCLHLFMGVPPAATKSFAIIVGDDPDAAAGTWVH